MIGMEKQTPTKFADMDIPQLPLTTEVVLGQQYVSIKEAGRMLGLNYTAVHKYITQGKLAPFRLGHYVVVRRDQVSAFGSPAAEGSVLPLEKSWPA
jgi:hypothetical protein